MQELKEYKKQKDAILKSHFEQLNRLDTDFIDKFCTLKRPVKIMHGLKCSYFQNEQGDIQEIK